MIIEEKQFVKERKATNMGKYLNPSNKQFRYDINSKIFVDKTALLIKLNEAIHTRNRYFCVSRPRRFGKTMALNSMVAYYSRSCDSKELFEGLEISKDPDFEKHLNAYDVIRIDMTSFVEYGKDFVKEIQRSVVEELKNEYTDLEINESMRLKEAIQMIHQAYGIEYIFLIDEWDMVFRQYKEDDELQREYILFLQGLFKDESFTSCIKLAYMTGILPIKKYNVHSALNNFKECTILDSFGLASFYGFTEEEIENLCINYSCDFNKMKEWYDGYLIDDIHIYNPKSVVDCIENKKYKSYWTTTESFDDLKNYINLNFDGLRDTLKELILGNKVKVKTGGFNNDLVSYSNKNDVLTLLIHLGYLTYDYETKTCWIPNKELREQFEETLEYSNKSDIIKYYQRSKELMELIYKGKERELACKIREYHCEYISLKDYNNENALKYMLKSLMDGNRDNYIIKDEFPSGEGIVDLLFVPKKDKEVPSVILECKWNKDADIAIDQIESKQYFHNELLGNHVICVGINYDTKTKEHSCKIVNI